VAAIRAATDEQREIGTEADPYPDIFEFTHHPITVYRTDTIGYDDHRDTKPVSEDSVYEELDPTETRNDAVVIQGTVGTGKSELCTYLTHRLKEDGRPILEVRKDDDLMTLLTERIPDFYENELGETFPNATDYERIREALGDPERTGELSNLIVVNALTDLRVEYDISCTDDEREDFIDHIVDNLDVIRTVAEEEDRGSKIITRQDYDKWDYLQVFDDDSAIDAPADLLNRYLWQALLEKFNTKGLKEIFTTVAEKFDRRPVAVFEDFSIASVQAKELGEFIERDIHGDAWDFIIAGTPRTLSPLRTQTFLSRFSVFQTNREGSNQVDFLTEDNVVEFIEPYLTYIKAGDESVDVVDSGLDHGLSYDTTPPQADSRCGTCDVCPNSGHYLFPFNEVFIERIYNPGLPEDARSPRELIKVIKEILEVTFYGPVSAPSSAAGDLDEADLKNTVSLRDAVYEAAPEFADLAKWYGVKVDGYAEVPRHFGDVFGLTGTDKGTDEMQSQTGIEISAETIRVPLANTEIGVSTTENTEDDDDEDDTAETTSTGSDDTDPTTQPETSLLEREYDRLSADVDNWRQNPTDPQYEEVNRRISEAFEDLFEHLTGSLAIQQGSKLRYNLSKSKQPFEYAGIGEQIDDDQVKLDPEEFRRSTLRNVLKYGLELEHGGGVNRTSFLRDHGTQLSALADRWQTQIQREYVDDDELLFDKRSSGYAFDDFIVAGYALCVLLDDPWRELTAETLQACFEQTRDLQLDATLAAGLEDGQISDDQIDQLRELVQLAPRFEDLLEARMSLSGKQLDLIELRNRLDIHDPNDVLDDVVESGIERVSTQVRFNSDTNVRDMAHAARKANQYLSELESNTREPEFPARLTQWFSNVKMTEVDALVSDLQTQYRELLPPEFDEQLTKLTAFDQADIEMVLSGATIATRDRYDKMNQIHRTVASRKLDAHSLVSIVRKLNASKTTDSDSFAPMFSEVSEYYVDN
jgi:hypothetical protein